MTTRFVAGQLPPTPRPQRLPGPFGGRYVLGEELGHGGMGVVYRAHDTVLGRAVAIKVVADEASASRFLAEAQRTAQIRHPAVVEVFDVAVDEGRGYIVMELLEGETLHAVLRRDGPLAPEVAVTIASRICEALTAAHALGVVHRDIKPANVFLPRGGEAKVLDFGIAKKMDGRTVQTVPGMLVGTLKYMAPEQIRGSSELDGRVDLYALGVLLFEALAGRPPFQGDDVTMIRHHLSVAPPPLRTLAPGVSPHLEEIVHHLLAKEPAARPSDAETVRRALQQALGSGRTGTLDKERFERAPVLEERFRFVGPLGAGSMGAVHRAFDVVLGREVAIKILHPYLGTDDGSLARMREEARALAALGHPNIVQIFDFCPRSSSGAFLVMELLQGTVLQAYGKHGVVPNVAVALTLDLLSALGAAHATGTIHRDIKPGNLFVVEAPPGSPGAVPRLKVLDFGLARMSAETLQRTPTATGTAVGTPAWMAPEQTMGRVGQESDLYAAALVLYWMLARTNPFSPDPNAADRFGEAVHRVRTLEPTPLDALGIGVRPGLSAIVMRGLAKDPAMRFRTAEDFAAALRSLHDGVGASIASPMLHAVPPIAAKTRTFWPALMLGVGLAGIGLFGFALFILSTRSTATNVTPTVQPPPGSLPAPGASAASVASRAAAPTPSSTLRPTPKVAPTRSGGAPSASTKPREPRCSCRNAEGEPLCAARQLTCVCIPPGTSDNLCAEPHNTAWKVCGTRDFSPPLGRACRGFAWVDGKSVPADGVVGFCGCAAQPVVAVAKAPCTGTAHGGPAEPGVWTCE